MFLYEEDRKKEEHAVKILFYDTKSYDKESFEAKAKDYPDIQIEYLKSELVPSTAKLAKGYDAICAFVSSDVGTETIDVLSACGVKLILMRCAGFNNVDVEKATACGIKVMRVPGYSPEAVAEHAMALALAANRRIHKAYVRVRENDFSLGGMQGVNFYRKTAGIVGTGKIGAAMARICHGFGMNVIAYDKYQNPALDFVTYVSLDELLSGEEMKKCVEKNPIVESPVIGRVQSALYALAGVAYLLMSISTIRFLMPELAGANSEVIGYGTAYILGYVLITLLLFCGLAFSIRGKLTPKKTGVIAAAYFGMQILSNIFELIQTSSIWPTVFQSIIYLLCIVVIVGYYFQTRRISPIPVYCVATFNLIRSVVMYFQMLQLENGFAFIVRTIWLIAVVGYMGLMAYQAYSLEKKWRLAVK